MEQHKTERPVVLTTGTSVSDQPSWLSSLCAQVRESYAAFRNPPPPIHVTARLDPDGVRELWGKRRYRAQILSFAVYAALIGVVYTARVATGAVTNTDTVIVIATSTPTVPPVRYLPAAPVPERELGNGDDSSMNDSAGAAKVRPPEMAAPPKPADDPGGGGGGGKQEDTPATKGELPPVTTVQLTIPMPVPMNQNPAIAAPPSVVAQNAQPFSFNLPTPDRIGILLGEAQAPPSSGMGRLGGIGDDGDGRGIGNDGGVGVGPGCCMGVSGGPGNSIPEIAGNRSGPGGNPGGRGGINVARGNITEPVPIRQTKPPYSEDARRSRIQGAVVIDVIVQTDGTIDRNSIRLIRGPGYGLNESAIEDIKTWTFKPATENGRPIARAVRIVVDFTLH